MFQKLYFNYLFIFDIVSSNNRCNFRASIYRLFSSNDAKIKYLFLGEYIEMHIRLSRCCFRKEHNTFTQTGFSTGFHCQFCWLSQLCQRQLCQLLQFCQFCQLCQFGQFLKLSNNFSVIHSHFKISLPVLLALLVLLVLPVLPVQSFFKAFQ